MKLAAAAAAVACAFLCTIHFAAAQAPAPVSPAPVAIGGPVGSPTYVVPPAPQEGGFLDVGQALNRSLAPFVDAAIQALLAAGLAWLALVLKKKWGIDISQQQNQTVQTWLTNQASSLIADGAVRVTIVDGKPQVQVNEQALAAHAAQWAEQIPQAAASFGLTPDVLAAKIKDKIPQVAAGAQMIAQAAPPAGA